MTDDLRLRAETLAKGGKKGEALLESPLSSERLHQVLHELQVHQIELEMQNEEMLRGSVELEAEREKYFDFYNSAPVGYATLSGEGVILEANLTIATMLGVPRSKLIRRPIRRFILQDDQGLYLQQLKKLFEADEPQACDLRIEKDDGAVFWANLATTVAQDADGSAVCRCVVSDITARKQTEESLISAMQLAESANKAKSEFLANMSHEIRTPLNGVFGMLQLMETTSLDDEQKEYILGAIKSTNRLTRLLSDILDLSRMEAGMLAVDEVEFDLMDQKESVLDLFALPAKNKELTLEFCIDEQVPSTLIGDEARLRQILFNLVGNAVKFTTSGHIRIGVSLVRTGNGNPCRVLFSVEDTGIGIPDDRLKVMFDPFIQGEGSYSRTFQGAGLGLSIVRRLVHLMGGCLSVDNTEGGGTTFYFSLPFKLPKMASDEPAKAIITSDPCGYHPHILLAEDDAINAIVTTRLLEKLGYTVVVAGDGQEVLKTLSEYDFDLILMDIQMPLMDGLEATKAIRASTSLGEKSNTPIISMTAYAMTGDRESFLAAGMDDYISKPVEIAALKDVIERMVVRGEKGRGGGYPPE